MVMSSFGRHLMREIASRTVAVLIVALLALLAERLLRIVELVTTWRGNVLMVFEMLAYLVPHYLRVALPAAFFLAVFLTFRRLGRDGELTALMACGYGPCQWLRPVYGSAVGLLAVQIAVVGCLEPLSRYVYRASVHAMTISALDRLLQDGRLITLGSTTYLAEAISADRALGRIFIHAERADGGSVVSTARAGAIEAASGASPLRLRLFDGLHQALAPVFGVETAPPNLAILRFQSFTTEIGASRLVAFRARGADQRELMLVELWQELAAPMSALPRGALVAELHGQVIRCLSILTLPLLAIPLALDPLRKRRSYSMIAGIVVLVIFHEVIRFGEGMVAAERLGPGIGLWLPHTVFALAFLSLFLATAMGTFRRASGAIARGVAGRWRSNRTDALRPAGKQ